MVFLNWWGSCTFFKFFLWRYSQNVRDCIWIHISLAFVYKLALANYTCTCTCTCEFTLASEYFAFTCIRKYSLFRIANNLQLGYISNHMTRFFSMIGVLPFIIGSRSCEWHHRLCWRCHNHRNEQCHRQPSILSRVVKRSAWSSFQQEVTLPFSPSC